MLLNGLFTPSFGSFGYYFARDVVQLSNFTISLLGVLSFITLIIGSQLYNVYLKNKEIRHLKFYSVLVGLVFAPLNIAFALRINKQYGIPDMYLIVFGDLAEQTLHQCLVFMPIVIVYAKICPEHIEATTFAFLTGTSNLMSSLKEISGSIINDQFVGVTQENLSNFYQLVYISTACSLTPLLYMHLIPIRK